MSVWGAILLIVFGIVIGLVIGGQWQVIETLNRHIDRWHDSEEDNWLFNTDEDD